MEEKDTVKDYQKNKTELVLDMVRKYPLYSVDRLSHELPEISRHSIQRILEKNNLSTVEKRLEFASQKKVAVPSFLKKPSLRITPLLKIIKARTSGFKNFFGKIRIQPPVKWLSTGFFLGLLVVIFLFWQGIGYIFAEPPKIKITTPKDDFVSKGERFFVSGEVVPGKSRVTINGEQVALNGNGSFTALVKIPTGESALRVEAVYRGKKAEVLQLVNREPTEEELQVEKEKQVREKREAADKAAELERVVNDLLAAKKATSVKEGVLRVLNNQIKEEAGFASVVGEVVNLGEEPVSWVMITANFLDQAGQTVDTKYGFATDFSEVIEPGERAEFETQATKKEFDHYSLDLSWEKGEVAGLATEPKEETASPAAEIEERKK